MPEEEFRRKVAEFTEREQVLDGSCRHEQRQGIVSKRALEECGLIRHTGVSGTTRIVIEWNADTETGWHRIVTEDPVSIAIREHRMERPRDPLDHPKEHTKCAE